MKKIIILIAILCGFGFCKTVIDYNKVLPMLGYNCKIEKSMFERGKKYFFCDSGSIEFNFNSEEISINYKIKSKHKKSMTLLFNRGWAKNRSQIHKEKSVICLVLDEFNEPVYGEEHKWSGALYDLYERFKEDVYYSKQDSKPENEEPATVEESVYSTENEVKETETKDTYTEYRIAQIMEKYK
jgi:hypothetical protein